MLLAQMYLGRKHAKIFDFILTEAVQNPECLDKAEELMKSCVRIDTDGLATVFWKRHFIYFVAAFVSVVDLYRSVWLTA